MKQKISLRLIKRGTYEFSSNDVEKAISDIDNLKYDLTCRAGTSYELIYNGKIYHVKQICECVMLNKGINITSKDFKDDYKLRNSFRNAGFEIRQKP